jgi:hypothetical protein
MKFKILMNIDENLFSRVASELASGDSVSEDFKKELSSDFSLAQVAALCEQRADERVKEKFIESLFYVKFEKRNSQN